MKKIIVVFMAITLSFSIKAQNQKDTTLVHSPCTFTTKASISTKGTPKMEYYITTAGDTYVSDATSYKRYKALKRFGATPNYAMITDRKTKAKKIIIL